MKGGRGRFCKSIVVLLFTLALISPLTSWLNQAQGQKVTKLNMGYLKIADLSPMFFAVDKGYFKEDGLELNLTPMVGGAAIAPALASGALNIGWSQVVTIAVAHSKGFDFKYIANGPIAKTRTNEVSGIQVLRDSPIRTGKDLEGKVLATNTLQSITQVSFYHWIEKHGGDWTKVKMVEVPFPAMEAALREKRIDAFSAPEPFVTIPAGRTTKVLGYPFGEIAPRLLLASYFTSGEWADKNADTVRGFIRALNKGIDYHNKNLEEAKAIIAKWTGLDPALLGKMAMSAFEKEIVPGDIQVWIDLAVRYKMIEKSFKAEEMIHRLAPVKRG